MDCELVFYQKAIQGWSQHLSHKLLTAHGGVSTDSLLQNTQRPGADHVRGPRQEGVLRDRKGIMVAAETFTSQW